MYITTVTSDIPLIIKSTQFVTAVTLGVEKTAFVSTRLTFI